ncbi:MAG: phosphatase PAP2 family protein [bacterium]|nr:phosphatase PAP2 family protein [bacterium]
MSNSAYKAAVLMSVAYLVFVSIFLVSHRSFFSPDQFFVVAILVTLFLGKFKQFIRDWSAPIVLLLSYDYLRGLAPKLISQAHVFPMINFDKAIFGSIPTNDLQSLLFADKLVHWYDYVATVFYMSHFIVPMLVGFIFWLTGREIFKDYFLALLLLSYAAFFTYVLFPAVPPWMASQYGVIPEVFKIMDKVFLSFPQGIDLPSVYKFVGANLVAAVPSLHAAYPFLTLLFFVKRFKSWGLLVFPYVLGVWLTIVYLGEHYVFDIVVGVLYASIAYLLVIKKEYFFSLFSISVKTISNYVGKPVNQKNGKLAPPCLTVDQQSESNSPLKPHE